MMVGRIIVVGKPANPAGTCQPAARPVVYVGRPCRTPVVDVRRSCVVGIWTRVRAAVATESAVKYKSTKLRNMMAMMSWN